MRRWRRRGRSRARRRAAGAALENTPGRRSITEASEVGVWEKSIDVARRALEEGEVEELAALWTTLRLENDALQGQSKELASGLSQLDSLNRELASTLGEAAKVSAPPRPICALHVYSRASPGDAIHYCL